MFFPHLGTELEPGRKPVCRCTGNPVLTVETLGGASADSLVISFLTGAARTGCVGPRASVERGRRAAERKDYCITCVIF